MQCTLEADFKNDEWYKLKKYEFMVNQKTTRYVPNLYHAAW